MDSLKEHLESRLDALEQRLLERQTAQDKAIQKSETAAEKRFESVNEFRGQLADQVKTFITRDTYDAHHEALTGRVTVLEKQTFGAGEHERGGKDQTRAIYAFIGFLVTVVALGTVLVANGVFTR